MIANYHTHTCRCNHATGTDEDYVKESIRGGLRIMGFSDHAPCWYESEYYARFRMPKEHLWDYCENILTLKNQFADQIAVHVGLEAEFFPVCFREMMSALRDSPLEYLLLGQHFIGTDTIVHDSHRPTESEELLSRYCDQVIDAMQTGIFTYVAHPDLMNFTGDGAVYRKHMARLCREAKACGLPLEINLMGIRSGKHYPDVRFWEIAAQENCYCVLGSDAHSPETVIDTVNEGLALEMIQRLGLTLLETVALRSIR